MQFFVARGYKNTGIMFQILNIATFFQICKDTSKKNQTSNKQKFHIRPVNKLYGDQAINYLQSINVISSSGIISVLR